MSKILNQNTLIPMGLAVVVIGGAATWIGDLKNQVKGHEELLVELKRANEANNKLNYEINSRLSRIEWKLERANNPKENPF